jgi:hypothetical protein
MTDAKHGKQDGRKLAHLVREAVDDGANSVEEIHRAIAGMPLDVLERLDLFEKTVKDVRKVQDTSIGAIYDLIHRVNREVTELATELLDEAAARGRGAAKAARKPLARGHAKSPAAAAHAR